MRTTYLRALLCTSEHLQPVPHMAAADVYKQILDPGCKLRHRRKRLRLTQESARDPEAAFLHVDEAAGRRSQPVRQRARPHRARQDPVTACGDATSDTEDAASLCVREEGPTFLPQVPAVKRAPETNCRLRLLSLPFHPEQQRPLVACGRVPYLGPWPPCRIPNVTPLWEV